MADQDFEAAAAELRKALDERLDAYLARIESVVHDQVLAVLRDEGYREVVRRVWDEKIGDSRGAWAARAVVNAMQWRVKDLAEPEPAAPPAAEAKQ